MKFERKDHNVHQLSMKRMASQSHDQITFTLVWETNLVYHIKILWLRKKEGSTNWLIKLSRSPCSRFDLFTNINIADKQ
jgi:hypothetical protein